MALVVVLEEDKTFGLFRRYDLTNFCSSDESSRGRGGGNSGRGRGDFQGGRGGRGGFDSRAKIPVIPNDRKLQLVTNMYPVKLSVKLQEVFKRYYQLIRQN